MDAFIGKVYDAILQPAIFLIFALAFLYFIWGLVTFIRTSDSDEGRETGRRNIIWGLIGMLIMASVFGIITIITGTIGAEPTVTPQMKEPFEDIDKIDVKTDL